MRRGGATIAPLGEPMDRWLALALALAFALERALATGARLRTSP